MGTTIEIEDNDTPEVETETVSAIEDLTEAVETLQETIEDAMSEDTPEPENTGAIDVLVNMQAQIDGLQAQIADLHSRVNIQEVEAIQEAIEETEAFPDVEIDTAIVVEPEGDIIEPERDNWIIQMLHKLPRWMW